MITGYSEKAIVVESLNVGASDFVVKPFDRAALLTKVDRFLGVSKKH
jgi:FixJ family two-component response regulator